MKRNRLIPSSKQANIFSNKTSPFIKGRRFLTLSLLTFSAIFITGIVLATSKPIDTSLKSTIIDLPHLPADMQTLSTISSKIEHEQVKTLATFISPSIMGSEAIIQPLQSLETHTQELAAIEQRAITQADLHVVITEPLLSTADQQVIVEPTLDWQDVTVKSGDNLSLIFQRVGLGASDTYKVAKLGKEIKPLLNLRPGQILRFRFIAKQEPKSLQQLQLVLSPIKTLNVQSITDGYQAKLLTREVNVRQKNASGTIESSLFEAGMAAKLSDKLIMELAYIFGWDIDFALDLRQQDHFTLIYEEEYLDGDKIADGQILAAEFTNRGKTYRAVRYTNEEGESHYFTPKGDSMRKAFSRTPVHFSRISSKFNPNRKHPILKTSRPHQGVDYAAATGTPILATGDGKVNFVGRKGGYGRTVVLSHGGKYTTLYAHMSKFKRGIKRGSRVKQGEVIGYLGMSGLATGPHLHYEFRVHGVHRNPLTVALPKAEALAKKYSHDFKQKSQALLAKLNNLSETRLAVNETP
jgi:murein DD-endopeptidase MepM/ murein hydrolase activator NlpD